jgi:hypothetical protein
MTLTRTQMHERAGSLSGEIKAAREAQSECRRALEDQERLVTIAVQAVVRADARVEELLAERAELAQDMAQAILQVGEAPVADEAAPNVPVEAAPDLVRWRGSFEMPTAYEPTDSVTTSGTGSISADGFPNAIFNGVDRAYDEATQP